jgi:1-acyl-sn-glycerol-3-phosphate acyltransferase
MSPLYDFWPRDDPSLHNQKAPSPITREAFISSYAPVYSTTLQKIMRVFSFIVFLGWLRLLIFIAITIIFVIITYPISRLGAYSTFAFNLSKWLAWVYCRALLWCFGIYWVRTKGKRSPTARQISFNHTNPLDGGLVFVSYPCCWVLTAGIKTVPAFGWMMGSLGSVFVDRSRTVGNSDLLKKAIEDHGALPLAIAPEGKISNGDLVFRVRTGGFRAEEEIQPLALRYYRLFPQLGSTLCWLSDSALDYFFQAFPSVAYAAEATFLDPITPEQLRGKTPQERADMVQLAIANYLGTLAVEESAKACFQSKEKTD